MAKMPTKGPLAPSKKMEMSAPSPKRQKVIAPDSFNPVQTLKKGGKVKAAAKKKK
jgi:hypothetical protein